MGSEKAEQRAELKGARKLGSGPALRLPRRAALTLIGGGAAALLGGWADARGAFPLPRALGRVGSTPRPEEARRGALAAARGTSRSAPGLPLPPRPVDAPTGSELARRLGAASGDARERALVDEVLGGNVPAFLRTLVPVRVEGGEEGEGKGGEPSLFIHVIPDYLCVGSDDDFLRIPLTGSGAQRVADAVGCVLPTPRMVDAVHRAAARLVPQPLEPGPEMTSIAASLRHHALVEAQRRAEGHRLGDLLAGHKKDVVVSARLERRPDRVAIYGLHGPRGRPVQPLSLVHAAAYVDYAHGVRLVWGRALLDGQSVAVGRILRDPALAPRLSDEGPLASPRYPAELPA